MATIQKTGNTTRLVIGDGITILVSYRTPVAAIMPDNTTIRTDSHHSVTTSKHTNKFLGRHDAERVPQQSLDDLLERLVGRSRLDP